MAMDFWDRLGFMGAGMAQGDMLGAMSRMQQHEQNMAALQQREAFQQQQLAQQLQAQQQLEQHRAMQTQLAIQRMNRPSPNMQNVMDFMSAPPDVQAVMKEMPAWGGGKPGTVVNVGGKPVTPGEAKDYAGTESLINDLKSLQAEMEGGADISGLGGLWAEMKSAPTITGAIARETFGLDEGQARAVRLAKVIETQAAKAMQSGALSDQDVARVKEALGLIGGADTEKAVSDLLDTFQTQYTRRRGIRGQGEAPGAGDIKVIGIRRLPD